MTANARTRENAYYAAKRRTDLVLLLAPDLRCQNLECLRLVEDTTELEIDHVNGRSWNLRKLSSSARVARYWREYKAGIKLRILCSLCNATDGGHRRHQ